MLSNIATRTKLFILSGTLLLLMALQIGFALFELNQTGSNIDSLITDRQPKIEQQNGIIQNTLLIGMLLREGVMDQNGPEIEESIRKIGELRADSTKRLTYLQENTTSAESKALLSEMEIARAPLAPMYEKLFAMVRANQDVEATALMRNEYDPAYKNFLSKVDAMMASQKNKMRKTSSETQESFVYTRSLMIASGILATVLGLIAATWIARSISHPLSNALREAERIAQGDLRANNDIKVTGTDEPSRLLLALQQMRASLHDMTKLIQQNAVEVSRAAQGLADAAKEVANSAQSQSAATSGAAATLEQLTVSIHHVADNAEDAAQQARTAGNTAKMGGSFVQTSSDQMSAVGEHVSQSATKMSDLEQDVGEIGKMATMIREVADQTNLLALNAAIEAARAGETGRGFAVVADEVRKLAERTTKSAHEISTMISRIQNGSSSVNQFMADSVASVQDATLSSESAALAMDEIEENANAVVNAISQISDSLKEQKLAGQDLAARMEQVSQMAEENGDTVMNLASTANQLSSLAGQLQTAVSRFKI
ncbi:methyl-accepting chemotaxis protein [Chitinibacter bivalviorum]|uniref:Methyl-accepting chemotaxis protein n=1 Tax=Chitinibacter bivalviorum TaxID=2739434 RepID=A0A7H9BJZ6_9NEIS|nr:methyl-accepting chemotaxis protein [Chitinibacter bivalviorum]QLG89015.1 methyl-accepting chemotaxis protein [Chitinibacter bivalviorum]